jgi:GNAT superfamily N-acetyltransferase
VLRSAEVPEAAAVLARAFWEYPETLHLLGTGRRRRAVLPRFLASDCRDAIAGGGARAARDASGRIVGLALWLPPGSYPVPVRRQVRQLVELLPSLPWTAPILPELVRSQRTMRPAHPREAHFYLRVLGVDPRVQGTGVGSGLMKQTLAEADRLGVGCYLTTAVEVNVAWYARFGFEVLEELRPTPAWPVTWRLWRPPAPPR